MKANLNSFLHACVVLFTAFLLASCGEKDNLQLKSDAAVTSCSALLNVTCVTGRLVDDAAFNVNYECGVAGSGTVHSVTAEDGSFICPNGSLATFSLINPNTPTNKIVLGQVTIAMAAKIFGDNSSVPVYFYVTPGHLAGDNSLTGFTTKAVNITRLLQTLSDDTTPADLPSRRIIIIDDDKRKITAATNNLDFTAAIDPNPASPAPGSFDDAVKSYLQSLASTSKHQLITGDDGTKRLQKGAYNTVAGIYLVPGAILGLVNSADTGGMVGSDGSGKNFLGAIWTLVDRRGRMIGSGVYSYSSTPNQTLWTNPQPMDLADSGAQNTAQIPLWPINGDLSHMKFKLWLDGVDTNNRVNITNGIMRREAVVGSSALYANLFQETAANVATWILTNGTSTLIGNGVFTLEHTVPTATLMNPALWVPGLGTNQINFPLAITVTFRDGQNGSNASNNPGCTIYGCKIADVRMVILKDGNIISDFSKKCGNGIDPDSLVYSSTNDKEIPLGVIPNILDTLKEKDRFSTSLVPLKAMMTMLAMIPNDSRYASVSQYLPYAQFGSNLGDNSLLNVDASSSGNYLQAYGLCTAALKNAGLCPLTDTSSNQSSPVFAPKVATWVNAKTTMQSLSALSKEPNPAQPSSATQTLINNSHGLLEIAQSSLCL